MFGIAFVRISPKICDCFVRHFNMDREYHHGNQCGKVSIHQDIED